MRFRTFVRDGLFTLLLAVAAIVNAEPAPAARQTGDGMGADATGSPDSAVRPCRASSGAAARFVRGYAFTGNTAIPRALLERVAAPFAGRAITDAELQELLRRLTDVYVQAGFSTTRASVPDQDLSDGVVKIAIIEGFLERIVVSGAHHIDPGYVSERLQVGLTTPLNVAILNANLRLLMQERGIASIRGQLKPGTQPGGAILYAVVEEAARFEGGLRVANDRAPAVGGVRGAIEASAHNMFGRGDVVDLIIGTADGLTDLDFRALYPLSARGTDFTFRYFDAASELIEDQLTVAGAQTDFTGFELGLTQAAIRTPSRQASISARITSKQAETTLDGRPFSFSPGADNGKTDVKVARLGAQWTERRQRDYLHARFTYSIGIGGLGATVHDDGRPDGRFHAALAQLQWLHTFGPRAGSLFARGDAQVSMDALLPLEKFAVGGTYSVRGYRRARFVRDNGWSGSLEYRLPLLRLAIPNLATQDSDGQLALVVFVDAGRAWNDDEPTNEPELLLAGGPGLRWDLKRGIRAEFYWGGLSRHVADSGNTVGEDIQDDGIHFLVSARRSF